MRFFTISSVIAAFFAALAQTSFTGDVISGYQVIDTLDLSDVPSNAVTRYWFPTVVQQGGIPIYLPIFVARGSNDSLDTGRKLSLSASIHGDELNGIPVVQRVFAQLNRTIGSGDFNGTVIGIPTLNPNGNQHNQRNFWSSGSNGFYTNLNRIFPGEDPADGAFIADAFAYAVWNNLWGNTSNIDVAVDLHCLTTGADGPLWAYADYKLPYVQRLAELAQPDIIKIDPGEPGSVETTWVDNSIPAITLEIGSPKVWRDDLIDRAEAYIYRLMADLQMTPNSSVPEIDLSNTYKGTNFSYVYALETGWVNVTVDVLDDVEAGQEVAVLYNSWGDILASLVTEVAGRVLQIQRDPAVEQGTSVVQLVYNATSE